MDFRAFDRARRQAGPLELDLVESYAKGSVSRREFVGRGTLIGLSLPFMSAIISACGSSDGGSSDTTAGGGTRPRAVARRPPAARARPAGPSRWPARSRPAPRPGGHAGPRHLRHHRPVLRVPGHPGGRTTSLPAWPRSGPPTTTAASGPSSSARASSGRTARIHRRPTWRRPWSAWSTAATPASRASSRRARWTPPIPTSPCSPSPARTATSRTSSPSTTRSRCITPKDYESGTTLDAQAQRNRSVQAGQVRPRHRRDVRPQRRLVGWQDAARRLRVAVLRRLGVMVTTMQRRRGRRHRPVPGHRRRRAVQRLQLQGAGHAGGHPPPDLDALRHRPVHQQAGAPGAGLHLRPRRR